MNKRFLLLIKLLVFFNNYCQKLYLTSIPKCGTHLLEKCVKIVSKRQGAWDINCRYLFSDKLSKLDKNVILVSHLNFSKKSFEILKKNNFVGIFIYRDPRDQLISMLHWIYRKNLFSKYGFNADNVKPNEIITKLIYHSKTLYESYIGWLKVPFFYAIKYEDLVGVEGGGNSLKQYNCIKKICIKLGINFNDATINNCAKNLYGGTYTFRNGRIGSWRNYFSEEQKTLFKKVSGNLLIKLGYEKDMNW